MKNFEVKNLLNSNLEKVSKKNIEINGKVSTRQEVRNFLNNNSELIMALTIQNNEVCSSNLESLQFAIKYNFDTIKLFSTPNKVNNICKNEILIENAIKSFGKNS